jgi:hypothetical protein
MGFQAIILIKYSLKGGYRLKRPPFEPPFEGYAQIGAV